jgi:hypothetical protein
VETGKFFPNMRLANPVFRMPSDGARVGHMFWSVAPVIVGPFGGTAVLERASFWLVTWRAGCGRHPAGVRPRPLMIKPGGWMSSRRG